MAGRALCVAGVLLLLGPASARATPTVQGSVALSGGWSDNVGDLPIGLAAATEGPAGEFFGEVSPSITINSGSARLLQSLSYTLDLLGYLHTSWAYSNRLDWNLMYTASPRTQIVVGAYGFEGGVNTLTLGADPTNNQVGALPTGLATILNFGASEGVRYEASPVWLLTEALMLFGNIPVDNSLIMPAGVAVDPAFQAARVWKSDSVGGELRTTWVWFGAQTDANGSVVTPAEQQLISRLQASWKHDFGHFFSTELGGGAIEVMRVDTGGGRFWDWAGLAGAHYVREQGQLDLVYTHGVEPSLLVGQTFDADQVYLRGAIPLARKVPLTLALSTGFMHARQIDTEVASTVGTVDDLLVDLLLSYAPNPEVALQLRYQLLYQLGSPADPTVAGSVDEPNYLRNTVMFTIVGHYPPGAPQAVPSHFAQRVDGADVPSIPAPHAPPPEAPPAGAVPSGAPAPVGSPAS